MTDYTFPLDWVSRTPDEKCMWYTEERSYRQAMRQATASGWHLRCASRQVYR